MNKKNKHSILMLHGLGGSPAEMVYLQTYFEHKGYHVQTPLLPHHGTHYLDLKKLTAQELNDYCQKELDKLFINSEKVSVLGLCLGAVMTLKLALDNPEKINSIIPISTTLLFDGWGLPVFKKFLPVLKYTPAYFFYNLEEGEPYGVKSSQIRKWLAKVVSENSSTHYSKIPLKSIFMMSNIIKAVCKNMNQISCPTLAIHAQEDEVCSLANLDLLEKHIKSPFFNKLILTDSYHLATIDQERSLIAKEVFRFLNEGNKTKDKQNSTNRTGVSKISKPTRVA